MKKIIAFMLALGILLSMCGCTSTATVSDAQTTESPAEEGKSYTVGDEIFINTDSGEYKFTITDVEETDYRNEFSDKKPDRVIVISYNYENVSYNSDLYISDMNFKAYDKDNNSMDTYPVSSIEFPDSISAGRKTSGQMAYGLDSAENYVELEYYDNMFLDSDCKIVLKW